ncbi:YoaK family protein [Nonomuraea rubra]|uniref:YoaK family protein n=1 Tax=Nonomuraea rubra TaxID=46180 RepID=UPI0033F9547E
MRMARFSMLGLALAAGAVDALSFLALGQVFTANMTGNVVLLGLALGYGRTAHVMASGLAFAGFCAGLAAGFLLVGRGAGGGAARGPAAALGLELVLLAGIAVGWWAVQVPRPALVAASAVAMGLQSAVTRWAGGSGLSTTYVTGTVTGLAGQVVALWRPGRDGGKGGGIGRPLGVVLALAVGAVIAALALRLYEPAAPLIAPVAVAVAAGWWAWSARRGR